MISWLVSKVRSESITCRTFSIFQINPNYLRPLEEISRQNNDMMWGIAGVLCVLNTLLFFIFLVVGNLCWAIKHKIAVGQSWEK